VARNHLAQALIGTTSLHVAEAVLARLGHASEIDEQRHRAERLGGSPPLDPAAAVAVATAALAGAGVAGSRDDPPGGACDFVTLRFVAEVLAVPGTLERVTAALATAPGLQVRPPLVSRAAGGAAG
jgi:hypothetical protein